MSPIEKPDPYKIDDTTAAPPGAAGPRDINPSFDVRENRGVYVVTLLRSEMLDQHEIDTFGGDLERYFAKKQRAKVILDMHGVHHLSSAALGMLLTLKTTIESTGGALRLAGIRDDLLQVFKLTKLHKVLKIKENVSAAMASL